MSRGPPRRRASGGAPRRSGGDAIAVALTLWLAKLAQKVVADLFKGQRDKVQSSWGRRLDQEEAVAFLVCDALGLELLQEEAGVIGKACLLALYRKKTGALAVEVSIKSGAAAKRCKARNRAEKTPELAAGLDARLREIAPGWPRCGAQR